jgi:alcohol dehydrogenase (cytochrome c)
LFIGRNDGRFTAVDAGSGRMLWEFQTGAGVNAPPAIFEHDGTQYVAVYSAGNLFAQSPKGDSVWLFSLDGTLDPVSSQASAPVPAATVDGSLADVRNFDPESGRLVYTQTCAFCHGTEGNGGHDGPALNTGLDPESVAATILNGRNRMPAFGPLLTIQEIGDVAAYLFSEVIQ